jgi:hypothetical protein
VDWTQWSAATIGNPGTASGTAGSVGVSYAGEVANFQIGYPSWTPAASFSGGSVTNGPLASDNAISIIGGANGVNTITFATAVTDPVFAIWSLGGGSTAASFDFINAPFTVESGGPNAEYGGTGLTVAGDSVSGIEANGTIQFDGTFKTISWTNPQAENYYDFTVGVAAVPEPATWAMLLLGFGGIGWMLRSARRQRGATANA